MAEFTKFFSETVDNWLQVNHVRMKLFLVSIPPLMQARKLLADTGYRKRLNCGWLMILLVKIAQVSFLLVPRIRIELYVYIVDIFW